MRETFVSLQFKGTRPVAAVVWTGDFRKEEETWLAECVELGTATYAASLDDARERLVEAVLLQLGQVDSLGFLPGFLRDRGLQVLSISPPDTKT